MLILGHRGARAVAPENTLVALREALAAGAAGSEFDVRMTADGVCVCTHDATIDVAGVHRRVCDLPAGEVAALRVAGPGGRFEPVPTLAEALDALAGSRIVAEVKNHPWDACYDPGLGVVAATAAALPPGAVLACFDPAALTLARTARPDVLTAVLTSAAFDPTVNLDAAVEGGHEICSVEHGAITPEFVGAAHRAGKLVYAWATDEPGEVRRLADAGADALMCDNPARAIAALS